MRGGGKEKEKVEGENGKQEQGRRNVKNNKKKNRGVRVFIHKLSIRRLYSVGFHFMLSGKTGEHTSWEEYTVKIQSSRGQNGTF